VASNRFELAEEEQREHESLLERLSKAEEQIAEETKKTVALFERVVKAIEDIAGELEDIKRTVDQENLQKIWKVEK